MGAKLMINTMNPFDYLYRTLGCKLQLLELDQPETQYILRYISPTQSANDKCKVKRIFKFERPGESMRFESTKLPSGGYKQKNRYLLWHGTGTENLISICMRGLIKAPSEARHNGNLFGKGRVSFFYFSNKTIAQEALDQYIN